MTELIQTLERLGKWCEDQKQGKSLFLNPGLSLSAIEKQTQGLPFKLSQEIRDLYHWRNGLSPASPSNAFASLAFCPLEIAIEFYDSIAENYEDEEMEKLNLHFFPLFTTTDSDYYLALCKDSISANSPIFRLDFDDWDRLQPKLMYQNLLSMMLTFAEACELNLFSWQGREYDYLHLDFDSDRLESIRLSYNPNIPLDNFIKPSDFSENDFCRDFSNF